MKNSVCSLIRVPLILLTTVLTIRSAEPLRVFIRAGQSNRGQEVHAHPRFLDAWTKLLTERGMKVEGGLNLPTAEQLARTDVLLMYAQDGGGFPAEQRAALDTFLKRGGGLVVIHTATVPTRSIADGAAHWKSVIGGSWVQGATKWLEGPMSLYYVDRMHPITDSAANFDLDDEIYYDMDMSPQARVLAAAYTPNVPAGQRNNQRNQPAGGKVTVYDIAPQMWTYENQLDGGQPYRAFVSIPGHKFNTFNLPHYRSVLLRGIAWAGKRANVDEFNIASDLETLRYPEGGPARPEKSLASMVIHPDFKMSIVASEPLINKAMNMDWDAQGRLWVCETPEYPDGRSVNPGTDYVQRWQQDAKLADNGVRYDRPAYDRISILTDTNGDGVMDKKQVFADYAHGVPGGLERVTSFVFYKDGVIASAAPFIWRLRDTNGDGVCDVAEKLFANLGESDTHAVINNLRLGFDGWIYATHGYSATANVTSGDGSKGFGRIGSGVVRFRPDGSAFEQYSSKGGNTWGLQISWDNEVFWTQPTSGDLLMHVVLSESQLAQAKVTRLPSFRIVSRSIATYPLIPYDRLPYVQIDLVGRFTAAAGAVIYDGGAWPADWNYGYFTTEPTINIVHHQIVDASGVSYLAHRQPGREQTEFIAGKDYWFRPIEVRTGPDGAVYVIDFYNQAVIHNDTRGPKHGPRNAAIRPDRDHYYGRIWRVDHKSAKTLPVPNLAAASPQQWVSALESPNQHVRMIALRLLAEGDRRETVPALRQLVESDKSAQARVAGVWALARLGQLDPGTLATVARDRSDAVRKNAMMAVAAVSPPAPGNQASSAPQSEARRAAALNLVSDSNSRVRLEALAALATLPIDSETAKTLTRLYPGLDDDYLKAAFMIVANAAPAEFLDAALSSPDVAAVAPLVSSLTTTLASGNSTEAATLVIRLAKKPASQDLLKQGLLNSLRGQASGGSVPPETPELRQALRALLTSANPALAAAALPLAVKWDASGALAAEVKNQAAILTASMNDPKLDDAARAEAASTLLAVRQAMPEILPNVVALLGGKNSDLLQTRVVDSLGTLAEPEIGTALTRVLPRLSGGAQAAAFTQLLKRTPWSNALLDALESGSVDFATVGPANAHRLRLHPDSSVSTRAKRIIEKLRGPETVEKDALIAKFAPLVEKPGDLAKGRELFTVNCATCHKIGDLGASVGPALDGMGAHGPAQLLAQILDPNRELDFSFSAWSIEMTDGEHVDGIIARENEAMIALRNATGEKEILKKQVLSRRNTGRSLMPEGFEALGGEALRDLLTFISGGETRFRFIDLTGALTADTRKGMYRSLEASGERVHLTRQGVVKSQGVPFRISDHARHPLGYDAMVLRGGPDANAYSRTLPGKVEVKVGSPAKQLHFLGGVAGWGFPATPGKIPALKVTVSFVDGSSEQLVATNGVQFADYNRVADVPGSKLVRSFTDSGQLRFYSLPVKGNSVIAKLVFESFDNAVVPTTLAVTADLSADPLPQ